MPQAAMRRAEEVALRSDLFVVLGSSLVVYPAAMIPMLARRNRRQAGDRQPRADGDGRRRRPRRRMTASAKCSARRSSALQLNSFQTTAA
jgi:hypothetical protein